MKTNHFRFAFAAFLLVAAASAFAGHPIMSHEQMAGMSVMGFLGETSFVEIKSLIEAQGKAWEEHKKTNDLMIAAKADGKAVGDLEAKMVRIGAELDKISESKKMIEDFMAKMTASGGADEKGDPTKLEHKAAFGKFLRKGFDDGLGELQKKAYNITTDADGGYAVPEHLDRDILTMLRDISPMRERANVIVVGGSDYKKPVNKHGATGGWVDEDDARPATDPSQFAILTPFMGEMYAYPQATQQMLDDVFFNAESFITEEGALTFSEMEGGGFTTGDGVKKPKGFLAYPTALAADGTRAFGTLQHIASGLASDWLATANSPADRLLDVVYALKKGYRANARWMMPKTILSDIRKFKDLEGNYVWRPGLEAGQPDTLHGYGIDENEDMPAKAANALSLAFGDFKRGYAIVDRMGTRILRDPYTNKPFVGFYMTKRVGGFLADSQAIKLLKFSA